MSHPDGLTAVGIFLAAYLVLLWGGFRWARSRVNRRARSLAAALEGLGARVLATRPTASIRKAAEFDFELGGRKAGVEVRQWGRDSHSVSVRLDSRPMPALWIRRELGLDRMAKAIGLEREVQVGDAAFDQAAFISSSAPDAVVRSVLEPAEVRRLVQEILQRGYSVFLSKEGLRASTLLGFWSGFDGATVAPLLDLLAKLSAALPATDAAHASPLRRPSSPIVVIIPVLLGCFATLFALAAGTRDLVHPPIDNGHVALALLSGLILWPPAVYLAARMLRGRPLVLLEMFAVALALLGVAPFVGGSALFAVNSGLDHAAATHHRARVLDHYKRNKSTVWVEGEGAGAERVKIVVPSSSPAVSVGDTLEFDSHPGALGWTWVTDVRRGN
jgi:hypothetical protein